MAQQQVSPPLRIALVTNNYAPYHGGVAHSVAVTAQALRAQGHTAQVVTLDFEGAPDQEEHVTRLICPVRFKYKKNPVAIPWLPTDQCEKFFHSFKPDVVHVHHPFLLGFAALKAARALGIPVVFTYHTYYEQFTHAAPLLLELGKPLIRKKVLEFCNEVSHIIAPCTDVQKHLLHAGCSTAISVIPSGIHPQFFGAVAEKPPTKPFKLLNVGRFSPEKNIPLILDAFSMLDQEAFSLTLVGFGPQRDALEEYAYAKLGLSPDQVQFIIDPSQKVLLQAYRSADCFLFASTTDTQGLVLAEAMACGLPVIALPSPGARDIIREKENGFLVSSVEQMAATLAELAANEKAKAKLCQTAQKTALEYHPKTIARRLVHAYQSSGTHQTME